LSNKIKITQIASGIGSTTNQKRTLKGLGFKKLNSSKTVQDDPSIRGMIKSVRHLIKVENID
jgi:large subunit ribosomal protein L30